MATGDKKLSRKERLCNQHIARKFTEIKLLKYIYDVQIKTIVKQMKDSYPKLKWIFKSSVIDARIAF